MSWCALDAWGDVRIVRRLTGGIVNDVRLVSLNGALAVARLGRRTAASLDWEYDLLSHLADQGMAVPSWIPAMDGRFHLDGLSVMTYVEGREPNNEADWDAVAKYLSRVHALTAGWQQRPGYVASVDLVDYEKAAEVVDITTMPEVVVARSRRAWKRLIDHPRSVVHGDVNAGNVKITPGGGVVLIDWDEARVDASALDFGRLPPATNVPLDHETAWAAQQADAAWDAASCWNIDRALALGHLSKVSELGQHDEVTS
jgi:Ser/Thr protein kinase RdoA (MazF antagonist)